MKRQTIKEILADYKKFIHQDITIQGWVRAFRSNRFIALNDGSTIENIQAVVDYENGMSISLKILKPLLL